MTRNQADLTTGERIRLLRNRRRLSIRQLAEIAGVHFTTLARYEHDDMDPSGKAVSRLAVGLGTSADYLLGLKASPTQFVFPEPEVTS